jgi:transposase
VGIKFDPYVIGRMRAYSEDLRKKIVAAIERGIPKAQATRLFDVSLSSVVKPYSRTARQGRSLEPEKSSGRPYKIGEKAQLLLTKDVEERSGAIISQRRCLINASCSGLSAIEGSNETADHE